MNFYPRYSPPFVNMKIDDLVCLFSQSLWTYLLCFYAPEAVMGDVFPIFNACR